MIESLKVGLKDLVQRLTRGAPGSPPDPGHELRLVTAALLLHAMRADHQIQPAEEQAIRSALTAELRLSRQEIEELLAAAQQQVDESVSLYDFTRVINDQFSYERKRRLVELLFRVAFADAVLERHEEYLVRKVANLIYVSHQDFVEARRNARDS